MAFEKITQDFGTIRGLADRPEVSATVLKSKFDSDVNALKEAVNNLIEALNTLGIYDALTASSIVQSITGGESDKVVSAAAVKSALAGIGGGGDMLKSVYDSNADGVVDDSAALGGVAASGYLKVDGSNEMTGTLKGISPQFNKTIDLTGDGTRKLNIRWSSNGAGDTVFLYITPNGETEKGIASISSVNGYLYNLRIKDPTAFVFSDDTLKTSAAGDNKNVDWGYYRAFKIPNAAVIEFAATAKSGTWLSSSSYKIFKVHSGYIPKAAFKTSIELVQNGNEAILRNELTLGTDGWVYFSTQGNGAFTRMKGKIIIPASLL